MTYGPLVLVCFSELQGNFKGIFRSPVLSLLHGHFNMQEMGINSLHNLLTPKLAQTSPLVAFDAAGHQVSLLLVLEIPLSGIFSFPSLVKRRYDIGNYSL